MLLDVRAKNLDCESSQSWTHFFAYLNIFSLGETWRALAQNFAVVARMDPTASPRAFAVHPHPPPPIQPLDRSFCVGKAPSVMAEVA